MAARRGPATATGGASSFHVHPDGLTLRLRVTPRAGIDRIEGVEQLSDGRDVLKLRVAAVPDKGRANTAVIALLAEGLGVARSAIEIASGQSQRLKTVRIAGDGAALAARLEALLVVQHP